MLTLRRARPPRSSSRKYTATTTRRNDASSLLATEMKHMRDSLPVLLGASTPLLTDIAKYYFLHPSKQIRPLLVLLFANATNGLGSRWSAKNSHVQQLDRSISRPDVLNDWNPFLPSHTAPFNPSFSLTPPTPHAHPSDISPPNSSSSSSVLPTQLRLAQIVEMIHVASLLHDDVIDKSSLRRGQPSAPALFGNKLSVLAGSFVLARASSALSRLGDPEVTEIIASVIANLVEGELLQVERTEQPCSSSSLEKDTTTALRRQCWDLYMRRTYLKTASLIANGARASVALGGCTQSDIWRDVAYTYGRHLGLAFQLVDDVLDYEGGEATLGKPGSADLQLGLATGPALYAWEEHPEMGPLIARKFERKGDVEMARDLVRRSTGIQRTRDLANAHAKQAIQAIHILPESDAKAALQAMADKVVTRTH